ncbi:hypothetical protein EU528_14730, partial [Candidatus Thorarchaeota archaeon]
MRRFLTLIIIGVLSLLILSMHNTTEVSAEGEVVAVRGDDIPLSAQLLQNGTYGDPVPDQVISFYDALLDVYLDSAVTNQDGYASIIWSIPSNHPLDITPVNATFSGNETLALAPSCQWAFVHILSRTQIIIDNYSETLHPDDYFVLEIRLLNDINNPIVGAQASLFSATYQLAFATTNETGYALFTLECNLTWSSLGVNDLWVKYEQDLDSHNSEAEIYFQFTVEQVETIIEIENTIPNKINLTDSLDLRLHVETYEGSLPNSPLNLFLNSIHFDSVTTDQFGEIDLFIPIDSRFSLGSNTIRIQYDGTNRNTAAQSVINFDVTSPINFDFQKPENAILGIEYEFRIDVSDILGRYIPNVLVNVHDMLLDVKVSARIPFNSTYVNIALTFEDYVGLHTLNITITGNDYITNRVQFVDITVWSKPNLVLVDNSILGYAYPSQEIFFKVQLKDVNGGISERLIELKDSQNETMEIFTTDSEGLVEILITAPTVEDNYLFSFAYNGMPESFELAAMFSYQFTVTKVMPVLVRIERYEIIPPAHEITVDFIIRGLNGTYLMGVNLLYTWNGFTITTITQEDGS